MARRLEAHSKTEGKDPALLPSQEFLNRFPDRFFHPLLEPFFPLDLSVPFGDHEGRK
jgi:hypothetical protein